jgi:hypothetical protein
MADTLAAGELVSKALPLVRLLSLLTPARTYSEGWREYAALTTRSVRDRKLAAASDNLPSEIPMPMVAQG